MSRLLPLIFLAACGPVTDFNGYSELTGELTYRSETSDGTVICDVDLALAGQPYTGACSDCAFAFHVDPTVIEDRGTEDCLLPSVWTYVDDEVIGRSGLGYAEATVDLDGQPMDRALVGVGDLWGERPASAGVASDDGPRTEVSWDGAALTWSHATEEPLGDDLLWTDWGASCDLDLPELSGRRVDEGDGAWSATEDLDCMGLHADIWTFQARAGERVRLAMDTVSADTAFDTSLIIEGPDGCPVAQGDDVFACTFPPLAFSCGGGKFTPETTGTYRIIAETLGACTSPDDDGDGFPDRAAYRLSIEAEYDPGLTLEVDDQPRFDDVATLSVEGVVEVR